MTRLLVVALLAAAAAAPVAPAGASPPLTAPPPVARDCFNGCTAVDAVGDALGVARQVGRSDRVPGRGDASDGPAPGRTSYRIVEEHLAPTCTGNGLHSNDALCLPALMRCGNDGRVAFWVWHRVTQVEVGPPEVRSVGDWQQEDGSYCLGPDDAGVPTIAHVIERVHAEFQHVPLPAVAVRTDPSPHTLVNLPTGFSAGTAEPRYFDRQILGVTVRITATPRRWRWHFGDGQTLTTTTPGRARTTEVSHTYDEVRSYREVRVEVEWTGTFTVGADPTTYPVSGTAVVRSPDRVVDVREARAELVSR